MEQTLLLVTSSPWIVYVVHVCKYFFISVFQIRLVNISSNDIVDGNPKLTLGLLWAIILHWQVSKVVLISFKHKCL